jgi:hypothetical protein
VVIGAEARVARTRRSQGSCTSCISITLNGLKTKIPKLGGEGKTMRGKIVRDKGKAAAKDEPPASCLGLIHLLSVHQISGCRRDALIPALSMQCHSLNRQQFHLYRTA